MRELGAHPDIVSLHDCVYDPSIGRLSMVIDLMECNLLEFIRSRSGPFPPGEALVLIRHLLSALQHLHSKGFAHRDVKPENCFVTRATLELKLGDFGSMRNLRNCAGPLSEYVATRWYRPPEILLTSGFYGVEMDNWAVGCVLAELLLGRPLFPGSNSIDQLNRIHRILGRRRRTCCRRSFPLKAEADRLFEVLSTEARDRLQKRRPRRHRPYRTTPRVRPKRTTRCSGGAATSGVLFTVGDTRVAASHVVGRREGTARPELAPAHIVRRGEGRRNPQKALNEPEARRSPRNPHPEYGGQSAVEKRNPGIAAKARGTTPNRGSSECRICLPTPPDPDWRPRRCGSPSDSASEMRNK
jgi:serine/threonine protein kinase